jgi:hypothetical protein
MPGKSEKEIEEHWPIWPALVQINPIRPGDSVEYVTGRHVSI